MRFADQYAARVFEGGSAAQHAIETPAARVDLQDWRLGQTTSAYIIVTGENPLVDCLDLIVLATLSRMVVQDYWIPKYGAGVEALALAHARLEREAWVLGVSFLTADQERELHALIAQWREQNPHVRAVSFIHLQDFARSVRGSSAEEPAAPESVLGVVGLDPLSKLDPAVREIERSRLLAQRALFYAQRWPFLLDMQIGRLTYATAAMPETEKLLGDVHGVSLSVESASKGLPDIISHEREAAIDQIMTELDRRETRARALLADAQAVLDSGKAAADAISGAARSADELAQRFEKSASAQPAKTPSKPFDIDEYTRAAQAVSATAARLEGLLAALDHDAPKLAAAVSHVTNASDDVIDHAFSRAVTFVLIAIGAALAAAIAYKRITR